MYGTVIEKLRTFFSSTAHKTWNCALSCADLSFFKSMPVPREIAMMIVIIVNNDGYHWVSLDQLLSLKSCL